MAPEITDRYQRATDLLGDVLSAKAATQPRRTPQPGSIPKMESGSTRISREDNIQTRVRAARETPAARFCWQCHKPLHVRTDRCPFCGETQ